MSDNKLKVLVTIPSGFCFGLQHVTVDLFNAARKGIEPHFLLSRWTTGEMEKLVQKNNFSYSFSWLGMFSRKLDYKNMKMSFGALVKLPKLYLDFLRLCKKQNPDILFFANHHELLLLLPALRFTKRTVICHMHDPSPAIPFQQKTFKWYDKYVHHYIAISEDVKKRTIALGCSNEKITVVHNGIHLPEQHYAERLDGFIKLYNWPTEVFIIGITGQMTATKGHEDLLEAFEIALKKNAQLRLVIGGKKLEPLYTKLVDLVEQKGLTDYVKFTGWLETANDFYKNINVFVLASRHDEGYGLVVAEAMSFAKPVIITESGGAVEIVEDGVSGFIIPKKDPRAMADRLFEISADKNLYNTISNNAYYRILNNFSIEVSASNFLNELKKNS